MLLQLKHCMAHIHQHTQASTTHSLTSHRDAYKTSVRNEVELCNCGIFFFFSLMGSYYTLYNNIHVLLNSTRSTIHVNVVIIWLNLFTIANTYRLCTDYHTFMHFCVVIQWLRFLTHTLNTYTHTHTHVGFYGLRGLSIGVMVFILYKLYVLLPYTYPTPKLSPHRRRCISIFPQKNSLCMIYKRFKLWGHWKCPHKSPSPCNTYVIPMSLYKFVSS